MLRVEVVPVVASEDSEVHLRVQFTQALDLWLLTLRVVEEIIGGGEPDLPSEHDSPPMFMVRAADERRIREYQVESARQEDLWEFQSPMEKAIAKPQTRCCRDRVGIYSISRKDIQPLAGLVEFAVFCRDDKELLAQNIGIVLNPFLKVLALQYLVGLEIRLFTSYNPVVFFIKPIDHTCLLSADRAITFGTSTLRISLAYVFSPAQTYSPRPLVRKRSRGTLSFPRILTARVGIFTFLNFLATWAQGIAGGIQSGTVDSTTTSLKSLAKPVGFAAAGSTTCTAARTLLSFHNSATHMPNSTGARFALFSSHHSAFSRSHHSKARWNSSASLSLRYHRRL